VAQRQLWRTHAKHTTHCHHTDLTWGYEAWIQELCLTEQGSSHIYREDSLWAPQHETLSFLLGVFVVCRTFHERSKLFFICNSICTQILSYLALLWVLIYLKTVKVLGIQYNFWYFEIFMQIVNYLEEEEWNQDQLLLFMQRL